MIIRHAMILAAGMGMRMRPLTTNTAKPLLPLGGRPLIDHALDHLRRADVEHVVVNCHWQADRIEQHLRAFARGLRISIQREETLLGTGGAVRMALPGFAGEPFYVINGDAFWLDGPSAALERLAQSWTPETLDGVLLLHPTFQVHAEVGAGDFSLDKMGLIRRRAEREIVPYVYAGVQLIDARLFADAPPTPAFSANPLWTAAIDRGRLRGVVHDGLWCHLSTPADLSEAEMVLQARMVGETR